MSDWAIDELGEAILSETPVKAEDESAEGPKPPPSSTLAEETSAPELNWRQALKDNSHPAFKAAIANELTKIISKHENLDNYEVLFLYDDDAISNYHSDRLYSAARPLKDKDILLLVDSPGGTIEPAYLISKTLKRLSANKFVVAVPRRAKSAATLICLGADEIHMGMVSQLGPIDPQISGLPALALGNALKHIAELTQTCPGASELFAKYLIDQAPIRRLGYYERVSESAVQYAERLLAGRTLPGGSTTEVAKHLVHHYKDHSFVIDSGEAIDLLGDGLVKEQTSEYAFADEVYRFLDQVRVIANYTYDKQFWVVGKPDGLGWRNMKR